MSHRLPSPPRFVDPTAPADSNSPPLRIVKPLPPGGRPYRHRNTLTLRSPYPVSSPSLWDSSEVLSISSLLARSAGPSPGYGVVTEGPYLCLSGSAMWMFTVFSAGAPTLHSGNRSWDYLIGQTGICSKAFLTRPASLDVSLCWTCTANSHLRHFRGY